MPPGSDMGNWLAIAADAHKVVQDKLAEFTQHLFACCLFRLVVERVFHRPHHRQRSAVEFRSIEESAARIRRGEFADQLKLFSIALSFLLLLPPLLKRQPIRESLFNSREYGEVRLSHSDGAGLIFPDTHYGFFGHLPSS